MSTTSPVAQHAGGDDAALGHAEAVAALEHYATGRPSDPALVERIRARAAQVSAEIQRKHGLVDDDTFQSLLDDEA